MRKAPHPYDFSVMEEGYAFIFNTKGNKHISVFLVNLSGKKYNHPYSKYL